MRLFAESLETPVGAMLALFDEDGAIVRLDFLRETSAEQRLSDLRRGVDDPIEPAGDRADALRGQLGEYFAGSRRQFDLPLAPSGTQFEREVWDQLLKIPYGETISYGELAGRLGRPGASRAVGGANGANPIAVIVPCHRVIGADGSLTGYASGVDLKERLLRLEGALERQLF